MKELIAQFPQQLLEAIESGKNTTISTNDFHPSEVLVAGLGGSGIGAHFAQMLAGRELKIPFIVSNGYILPPFISNHTLFIASSYSGNTEETLECLENAKSTGAKIVCVTSGGKVAGLAQQNNFLLFKIKSGIPAPRAALAYSFIAQLYILHRFNLISGSFINEIQKSAEFLMKEQKGICIKAKKTAALLKNKIIFAYSSDQISPVALRFKQQVNENSKQHCAYNAIPEMNHNELVGWVFPKHIVKNTAVVNIRFEGEHPRTQARFKIIRPLIKKNTSSIIEINAKGSTFCQHVLYLVHYLDWVSYFLALENKIDPAPVEVINYLKNALAKKV